MTKDQTEAIKTAINEYFRLQKLSAELNDIIVNNFMLKLLLTGIDPIEAQEIYLEAIVKHAVSKIDKKSFEFLKPFIQDKEE